LKKVGARGRLAVLLAACLACLAMLWKQGVYTVREQPGARPSPLPTLALAAPLSRVAVAPLSVEATPPPPDGEEGICPKAGSIVISFLCGYGPLSSPRSRSTRLKQYDKTVVTPDAAWEKIHEEFESALKSILLSTRLDLTLIVFTNDLGRKTVQTRVLDKMHPTVLRRITYVPILVDAGATARYIERMGLAWEPKWAVAKIFVYELIPACFEWMIQVDTDILVLGDMAELWAQRHQFNITQLIGGYQEFAYNPKNMVKLKKLGIHVPDTKGFNGGVILMNLRRMREQELAVSLVLQANKKLQPAWTDPDKVDASKFYQLDQDVFNTVLMAFPHMRFELEPRWNVQGCGAYSEDEQRQLSARPGLFHFNCNRRQIDAWKVVTAAQERLGKIPIDSPALCACNHRLKLIVVEG